MEEKIRISGVIFEHGADDFVLWEGFVLSEEDENAIQTILSKYDTEGCSVRGTRREVACEFSSETVVELSENYGVIDLLTAAIMRNNGLSYEKAEEISLRLNSSDYLFDRMIDDFVEDDGEDIDWDDIDFEDEDDDGDCSDLETEIINGRCPGLEPWDI